MDYEKKYKEALERAKNTIEVNQAIPDIVECVESLFPELTESGEEKIRKEITEFFKNYSEKGTWKAIPDVKKWIDWLEKQAEQKLAKQPHSYELEEEIEEWLGCEAFPEGTNITPLPKAMEIVRETANHFYDFGRKQQAIRNIQCTNSQVITPESYINEGQKKGIQMVLDNPKEYGLQKPADKVEPKFHEGEWIVNRFGDVWHIDSFDKKNYQVSNGDKYCYFPIEKQNEMHLWTISDAKDGDVLSYKDEISLYRHDIKNCTKQETTFGGFVYYCCYDGKRFVVDSLYSLTEQDKMDIHPATKEQRDQLEKAMADAGYRWNTDEKKMEKIEQKPAWSEKDDEMLDSIIEEVRYIGDFPDYPTKEENELYDECLAKVEWLKSLKERYTWKPSDEQMAALDDFIYAKCPNIEKHGAVVKSLYQDLKKLKQ